MCMPLNVDSVCTVLNLSLEAANLAVLCFLSISAFERDRVCVSVPLSDVCRLEAGGEPGI